jgi:hypothetical protein
MRGTMSKSEPDRDLYKKRCPQIIPEEKQRLSTRMRNVLRFRTMEEFLRSNFDDLPADAPGRSRLKSRR